MKTIFLIAGESGSGKDTLVDAICEEYGVKKLNSYTTRKRRPGEGNTHVFIPEDEVAIYQEDMIAFTYINGNMYFATKEQLLGSDFYIIDPNGIDKLYRKIPPSDSLRYVTIYITAPWETRKSRALLRGDSIEKIESRHSSETAQFDRFRGEAKFDYAINNADFGAAYSVFETTYKAECKKIAP